MPEILDVRGLPHRERPPRIFNMLSNLKEGDELVLLVEIEPLPLYGMLRSKGYTYQGERQADGSWRVRIRR